MPDFKYWSPDLARRHLKAEDYPQVVRVVVREMHRQVGPLRFDRDGMAVRGLLVRHLVMPGQTEEAAAIFAFLAGLSPDTYVNIMGQYHPEYEVGRLAGDGSPKHAAIDRTPTSAEMRAASAAAAAAGLWRFDQRAERVTLAIR